MALGAIPIAVKKGERLLAGSVSRGKQPRQGNQDARPFALATLTTTL
jgi:hypothetical protein